MENFGDYKLKIFTDGKTEVYKYGKLIATYGTTQEAKSEIWNNRIEKKE